MLSIIIAVASGFIAGTILVIILDVIALWYWLGWVPKEDPKLVPRYENVKHSKVSHLVTKLFIKFSIAVTVLHFISFEVLFKNRPPFCILVIDLFQILLKWMCNFTDVLFY